MSIGEFFSQNFELSDPAVISALSASSAPRHLNEGELLLREGEVQHEVPFLVHGVIRGFYFDENGKEITDCLVVQPGMPAVAMAEIEKRSSLYLQALEESDLLVISIHDVRDLLDRYPVLMKIYNQLLVAAFSTHWELKAIVCREKATERYKWFLQRYPGLIERISNKYIASFLGITPVTLSRIRRQLRDQKDVGETTNDENDS